MSNSPSVIIMMVMIRAYQLVISPIIGSACRFEPSCSNYAMQAIERYGAFKGGMMSVKRLLRCHPWCPGGYDPVPPKSDSVNMQ